MKINVPRWAMETATPQDRLRTQDACWNSAWQITWPAGKLIRDWAKQQGWPSFWFNFKGRFIKKMFENDANFTLALQESGLQILIPRESYPFSDKELKKMDRWYEEREDMGALGPRPTSWGVLVESLREIRRAIAAGVVIEIDDQQLKSIGSFLTWAHKRYHLLEDGYDSWYGDDES